MYCFVILYYFIVFSIDVINLCTSKYFEIAALVEQKPTHAKGKFLLELSNRFAPSNSETFTRWPPVRTGPCPHKVTQEKFPGFNRGVLIAHRYPIIPFVVVFVCV